MSSVRERLCPKPFDFERLERSLGVGSQGVLRTIMRTALVCAILAITPALGLGAESTQPSQAPAGQQQTEATPQKAAVPEGALRANLPDPNELAGGKPASLPKAGVVPVDSNSYLIGARDVLQIIVYREQTLTGNYVVRPDGNITMVRLGEIAAAGKSPRQLEKDITEKAKVWINEPLVTVGLAEIRSRQYHIMGEVLKPGSYDLIVPTRVLEALAASGGFKEFANQKKIKINRGNGAKVFNFNYKEVSEGKNTDQNIFLEPGDIIIVK